MRDAQRTTAATGMPLLALLAAALAGCAGYAEVYPAGPGYPPPPPHDLYIPEGHMPPPGECRIWYPGVEPGQQPPPGPCEELRYRVPRGAYLIRG